MSKLMTILGWGERPTTICFMNIVQTTFAIVEEDFNCFAFFEQRYYVEMLNIPCVIKEMDQEFKELVVGLNQEYDE